MGHLRPLRLFMLLSLLILLPTIHAQSLKSCPKGSFRKASNCLLCPAGTYQHKPGSVSCLPCPKGTFNPLKGAIGPDLCLPCPVNTFNATPRSASLSACKPCPSGQASRPGASRCGSCPAGKRLFSGNIRCERCPGLTVSTKQNSFLCDFCPADTNQVPNNTSSGCKKCQPGFGGSRFQGRCRRCSKGEFNDGSFSGCRFCRDGMQSNKERTGCLACPPRTSGSSGNCFRCKDGENIGVTGSLTCLSVGESCPRNFFKTKTGGCDTCERGERHAKNVEKCVPCKPNETSTGGTSAKCVRCGTLEARDSSGKCQCQENAVLRPNGKCRICPAGRFAGFYPTTLSPEPNFERGCETCTEGTFADKPGLTECKPCPEGLVSTPDRKRCVKCPKETRFFQIPVPFEHRLGPGMCVDPKTNCPPGFERRVDENGKLLSCQEVPCPEGTVENFVKGEDTVSGEDELQCLSCAVGEFIDRKSLGKGNFVGCRSCRRGTLSAGGVVFKCEKCTNRKDQHNLPEGFGVRCGCRADVFVVIALFEGMCTDECPGGLFAKDNGPFKDFTCEECPPGTARESFTDFSCVKCPEGTFADKPGSECCEECPEGTSSMGEGATKCVLI